MALPTNPQTLATYDLSKRPQANVFVKAVADILVSIYQSIVNLTQSIATLSTSSGLAAILNGSGAINANALVPGSIIETNLQTSLTDLGTVSAASSTINTNQSSQVFVRVSYTGTTAYTITLNNVALGAVFYFRIVNNAAAARTITVAANTPASVAYVVTLITPTSNTLSSGVSVTNGQAINGFGMAATVVGTPNLDLVGSIG